MTFCQNISSFTHFVAKIYSHILQIFKWQKTESFLLFGCMGALQKRFVGGAVGAQVCQLFGRGSHPPAQGGPQLPHQVHLGPSLSFGHRGKGDCCSAHGLMVSFLDIISSVKVFLFGCWTAFLSKIICILSIITNQYRIIILPPLKFLSVGVVERPSTSPNLSPRIVYLRWYLNASKTSS